jgi:hypothetical protein
MIVLWAASGFLTNEQKPISIFDKFVELQKKVDELTNIIKKIKGNMVVKLVDENGNEIIIVKNQLNKIFTGYYSEQVSNLQVKKGAIITKTYRLVIENSSATPLELISRIPGSLSKKVIASEPSNSTYYDTTLLNSYSNFGTYNTSDYDYNTRKKYDLVPIGITNGNIYDTLVTNNGANIGEIISLIPFQSSQVKGQFVYSRYKDVASEEEFYSTTAPDGTLITSVDDSEYSYERTSISINTNNVNDFIWNGEIIGNQPGVTNSYFNNDDCIEVHKDHPYIQSEQSFVNYYNQIISSYNSSNTISIGANYLSLSKQLFTQSKFINIDSNGSSSSLRPYAKKQAPYIWEKDYRTTKIGFETFDQYLLGKKSCGAYLFMYSDQHESICVDGRTALSIKQINTGYENAVTIPISFQYRMTDYYGQGNTGIGNIAGDSSGSTHNVHYSKQMGIDILDWDNNLFSFDLEFNCAYKSDNLTLGSFPVRTIATSMNNLSKVIAANLNPTINETR